MTEEEFAAIEDGNNELFVVLERVAIVRRKDDDTVGIAIARKMPPGLVDGNGEPLLWRSVTYRLDPGTWETMHQALADPNELRKLLDEKRAELALLARTLPAGRA